MSFARWFKNRIRKIYDSGAESSSVMGNGFGTLGLHQSPAELARRGLQGSPAQVPD